MSQNLMDSLGEMASWDEEMCQQNIHKSLPKILSKFEESTFIEEGINILQLICKSFLPAVPTEEMEDRLFSRVCKMICSLMTDVLNKVHLNINGALKDTADELKETIAECLQWIGIIVESLETCVRQMLGVKEAVNLSYIQSLPVCAVSVLKQAYTHCKESTDLYGDLLDDVGESLSNLFKKAHSLQSSLLMLLDKMTVSGCYEEHVHILCKVCSGLFEVCKVVNTLDIKLVISLWKAISRICSQNLTLMRDRFEVGPLISYLCEEVTSGYAYLFQLCPSSDPESLSQGDDKAFNKWVKIVGFQMKVLVALLRDFADYLGSCEKDVLCLLIALHRSLPPCLSAVQISEAQEGDIRSQIVSATSPILNHLISNRAFRIQLTILHEDVNTDDYLPILMLQLMVLDLLPKCDGDVIDYWMNPADHNNEYPTKPLVSVIFDTVRLCFLELRVPVMMPGIMVAGKPQRPVSLYEHVVVHICGFIGSCLSRHFSVLESTLLEYVLKQDHLSCLLATDAWCFMARFGTASLCDSHVQCLLQVYNRISKKESDTGRPSQSLNNLTTLIKRLIRFLSPPQQVSLMEKFPPERNLDLWLTLTVAPFCEQVQQTAGRFITEHALKIWSSNEAKLSLVLRAVRCLNQILADQSLSSVCLTQTQAVFLQGQVCHLWDSIMAVPGDLGQGQRKDKLAVELLGLTRHLIPVLKVPDILQIIETLRACLKRKSSPSFLLTCCHFLSDLAQSALNSPDKRSPLEADLAEVTHCLLTHTNPLVQSTSLTSIAALTTDVRLQAYVSLCIKDSDLLNRRLTDFLHKIPFGAENFSVQDFLRSQQSGNSSENEKQLSTEDVDSKEELNATSNHVNSCEVIENPMLSSPSLMASATDGQEMGDGGGGGEEENDNPPAKKIKMLSSHNLEENGNAIQAESRDSQKYSWQTILESLKKAASDLEQKCSSSPPPEWFTTAACTTLGQINDCLTVSASWFDSLA